MGIVFGDIGTSPLYVMKAIVGVNPSFDADYIVGAVSCVIWTLTLQTTVKYVLIALRADNKGEGGILALFSLLRRLPRKWLYIVAAVGASALIADGVITPAITVTSAIEGLRIASPSADSVRHNHRHIPNAAGGHGAHRALFRSFHAGMVSYAGRTRVLQHRCLHGDIAGFQPMVGCEAAG